MRAADLITALVLVVVGGVVIVDALRLGIGWGMEGPQSGFFPFWLAVGMVVTSAIVFLQAFHRTTTTVFATREQLRPVLIVLLPATAMVLIMEGLGLYVASAVYLAFY